MCKHIYFRKIVDVRPNHVAGVAGGEDTIFFGKFENAKKYPIPNSVVFRNFESIKFSKIFLTQLIVQATIVHVKTKGVYILSLLEYFFRSQNLVPRTL
jgi:hypothetical protein